MRLIHTSDWHLGRILYKRPLLEDQRHFIYEYFLPKVDELSPDAVLISGDIFDRQIAPADAIALFDSFISEICAKRKIKLLVSTGNHDGAERFALAPSLLGRSGLYITSKIELDAPPVRIEADGERADIYMLPYFDPARARDALAAAGYDAEEINSFGDAYRAVLDVKCADMDGGAVNILMAHCFAAGAKKSDSESTIYIGGAGEVPPSLFDRFDYAALGHLHAPQRSGGKGRYAGSPLKYSFDEQHQKKSITVIDIAGGRVDISECPVVPLRDMRTVSGTIDEIEAAAENDPHRDDYIYAEIKGAPVFEPMARLRKYYRNVLDLKNGSLTAAGAEDSVRDELRGHITHPGSSGMTVLTEFFRQMCGYEPDEEDTAIFEELLRLSADAEIAGTKGE